LKKIPNPTDILSTKYAIEYEKELATDDGSCLLGMCDPINEKIKILKDTEKIFREKIWLHEVMHAICKEINIKLTERELDLMANVLYDVFTRNKCDFSV
jgi:hypothetical protein